VVTHSQISACLNLNLSIDYRTEICEMSRRNIGWSTRDLVDVLLRILKYPLATQFGYIN